MPASACSSGVPFRLISEGGRHLALQLFRAALDPFPSPSTILPALVPTRHVGRHWSFCNSIEYSQIQMAVNARLIAPSFFLLRSS